MQPPADDRDYVGGNDPGEPEGPSRSSEPSSAPDPLVHAALQLAERHAELTQQWLSSIGYAAARPLNVPAAFLLELAAVLQIGVWERQGVCSLLSTPLPSYLEAAEVLAARARLGPKEFHGQDVTPLSTLVNRIWFERFAWDGPSILGADIVFGTCDDDVVAEQLANFLWQHHKELEKLGVT